jgi:hypothetical protein
MKLNYKRLAKCVGLLSLGILSSFVAFGQTQHFTNDVIIDGNVGIGTTSPQAKLHIDGNAKVDLLQTDKIDQSPFDIFAYDGKSLGHYSIGWYSDTWANNYGPTLWQSAYGGIKFFTRGFHRMSINADGNVGIGTTNPRLKLEVDGDIQVNKLYFNDNHLVFVSGTGVINIGAGGKLYFRGNTINGDIANATELMTLQGNGNLGIGTTNPTTKLDVVGVIRAHEVKVCVNQGCDYVFEDDYKLMSLNELNKFVKANKHLPEVAPAVTMESEGVDLSEMNLLLLKKIEELTLYMIEQNGKMQVLEAEIGELKAKVK